MKKFTIVCITILALAFALSASADTITYTLNQSNGQINAAGPWGTVVVDRTDATHATVTFNAVSHDANFALIDFFDGSAIDLSVNGALASQSYTYTVAYSGNSPLPITTSTASGQNVDGRGDFNLTYSFHDGPKDGVTQFVVTLTGSGTNWLSASDVLAANNLGYHVAVHATGCTSATNSGSCPTGTGYASDGPVPTPEPAGFALLGSGLLVLGGLLRRRVGGRG